MVGVEGGDWWRKETAHVRLTHALGEGVQSEGARVGKEKGVQATEQSIGRQWWGTVASATAEGVEEGRDRSGRDGR